MLIIKKTKKNEFILSILNISCIITSFAFTLQMFFSVSETLSEKILYSFVAIIIEGIMWISIDAMVKHYRMQSFKNVAFWSFLFILFFSVSLTASLAFAIQTVYKQMYSTKTVVNEEYIYLKQEVDALKLKQQQLEDEKQDELNKLNAQLDLLPLDFISRRNELEVQKTTLINKYDAYINEKNIAYEDKKQALKNAGVAETEVKVLKDTSISGMITVVATLFKIKEETLILAFALLVGVTADIAGVALDIYLLLKVDSKREMNKIIKETRNQQEINNMLQTANKEISLINQSDDIVNSYEEFINIITKYNIDIYNISFNDFVATTKSALARSSFYKYKNKYISDNSNIRNINI